MARGVKSSIGSSVQEVGVASTSDLRVQRKLSRSPLEEGVEARTEVGGAGQTVVQGNISVNPLTGTLELIY